MKLRTIIVAVAALILTATSCSILKGNSSSASSSGNSVGGALTSIYTQYKKDGKIDLTNLSNIINLATIANNIGLLKGAADTAASAATNSLESFVGGLISGSGNLVNASNSSSVVGSLTKLAGLDLSSIINAGNQAATDAATTLSSNAAGVASAVGTLTSIFKQFE